MIETPPLSQYFENATPTEVETFDIRFEKAVSLLEQDAFDEAIPLIEETFKEGCLDIRLLMQLFYAFFLRDGVVSFVEAFPAMKEALTTYWDKLSPIQTKESDASKSIVSYFSTISKRMKRSSEVHEKNRTDALWARTSECSTEELEQVAAALQDLITFLTEEWKLPSCQQYIQSILGWTQEVKETYTPPKASPPPPKKEEEKKTPSPPAKEKPAPLHSPKMETLIQKLTLFEQLLRDKQQRKASLVASDIQQALENFDPALYFPSLFSNYFALLAKHIDTLMTEWDQKGSPQWDALDKLYQTDIEAFVKW